MFRPARITVVLTICLLSSSTLFVPTVYASSPVQKTQQPSFFTSFLRGFSEVDTTIEQAFVPRHSGEQSDSRISRLADSGQARMTKGVVLAETTSSNTGFLGVIQRFFQSLLSPLQDIQVNLASQGEKDNASGSSNIPSHSHPELDSGSVGNRVSNLETNQANIESGIVNIEESVDTLLGRTLTLESLVNATEKEYTKLTVTKSLVLSSGDFSSPTGITLNATGALKVGDEGVAGVSTNDDDLYVQGNLETDGDLDVAKALSVLGNTGISGKFTSANTSVVHQLGNVYISGSNLEVPGTLKIQGVTYTFPGGAGSSSQVLTTDGVGTLSWNTVSGGDTTAQYLTLATSSTLSNERVLTAGTGITFDDTGANGTLTINAAGGGSQWTSSGSNIYYDLGVGSSYVGIGTSSPAYALDVAGDINTTGSLRFSGTKVLAISGTNILAIGLNALGAGGTGANNVGIGTSALFSNTTGTKAVAIGVGALKNNTTGEFNVGVGFSALASNTTGNFNNGVGFQVLKSNNGSSNTAMGYSTLGSNTTGSTNSAFGSAALPANTTGGSNIAIGSDTMNSNSTGSSNTAIGKSALMSNTTSDSNTAIGMEASRSNTTGTENTSVGRSALWTTSTGNYNVAIGGFALFSNTTASNNTGIGHRALQTNTTGTRLVAIGDAVLKSNTTANDNIGIGASAGLSNTTGTRGLFIGSYAGAANTTANDNLFIGYEAGLSTTTGTPNLAIGSYALRANTTGTFNVGIGTSALFSNTTGSQNIALGFAALDVNTTGTNNIAVGYHTLGSATTGANNTAVGSISQNSNTIGSYNTSVGTEALRFNTSGLGHTALGYKAVYNTTGNYNTGVGYEVLISTNTGGSNVGLGANALYTSVSGSNNIGIGVSAGFASVGHNNVFIGKNSASGETGSNKLYIDNDSSTVTPLIYGDFSAVTVGIGTTAATYPFHVVRGSAGVVARFQDSDGTCDVDPTSTALVCSSDSRLKKDVNTVTNALEDLNKLRPVTFRWNNQTDGSLKFGFIAQEVEQVFADLVKTDPQSGLKSLNTTGITPYLVAAVKEQQVQIDAVASIIGSGRVGRAILPAGSTQIDVAAPMVTGVSNIFLTPRGEVASPLFLSAQTSGTGFQVKTSQAIAADVEFSWWVVDSE